MHRPRWRGSPCERHALRVLPGIVVLAVFIIGVVIGNGAITRIRIAYSAIQSYTTCIALSIAIAIQDTLFSLLDANPPLKL